LKKQLLILSLTTCLGFQISEATPEEKEKATTWIERIKAGLEGAGAVIKVTKEIAAIASTARDAAQNIKNIRKTVEEPLKTKRLTVPEAKETVIAFIKIVDNLEKILRSLLTILDKLATDVVAKFNPERGKVMEEDIKSTLEALDTVDKVQASVHRILQMLDLLQILQQKQGESPVPVD